MEGHGQGNRMIQLLLATLRVGAEQEVLQVHVGVGLSCPEWDCRCYPGSLWKVEILDQGMVPGRVRPVGMMVAVRVGLMGAVNGDWFVTESGKACTCIINGGAGEGVWGS